MQPELNYTASTHDITVHEPLCLNKNLKKKNILAPFSIILITHVFELHVLFFEKYVLIKQVQ